MTRSAGAAAYLAAGVMAVATMGQDGRDAAGAVLLWPLILRHHYRRLRRARA